MNLALIMNSKGLSLGDPTEDTVTVEDIMTTSDSVRSSDGRMRRQKVIMCLQLVATDEIDDETTAKLTVFGKQFSD